MTEVTYRNFCWDLRSTCVAPFPSLPCTSRIRPTRLALGFGPAWLPLGFGPSSPGLDSPPLPFPDLSPILFRPFLLDPRRGMSPGSDPGFGPRFRLGRGDAAIGSDAPQRGAAVCGRADQALSHSRGCAKKKHVRTYLRTHLARTYVNKKSRRHQPSRLATCTHRLETQPNKIRTYSASAPRLSPGLSTAPILCSSPNSFPMFLADPRK